MVITRDVKIIFLLFIFISLAHAASCFMVKGAEKTMDIPSYKLRGAEYLPLTLICDAYGISWDWDPVSQMVDLSKGGSRARFRVDEYNMCENGQIRTFGRPVIFHKGSVCVPSELLGPVFDDFGSGTTERAPTPAFEGKVFSQPPKVSLYKIKKIALDAGHGGYDPGAIGRSGVKEKYIVLDIVNTVKELLGAEGIDVVLTRGDDRFIPLWSRADIANNATADIFISIHANASLTKRLKGFEVYYLSDAVDDSARAVAVSENYPARVNGDSVSVHTYTLDAILWDLELTENRRESIELARCILGDVDVSKERLKSAKFYVLKGASMPAILVEVGYITNPAECGKLDSKEYRDKIGRQIVDGILDYKRKFEDSNGFTE